MSKDTLHQRVHALRAAQCHIHPDAAWVRATRDTLVMQARNSLPESRATIRERARAIFTHLMRFRSIRSVYRPVVAICSSLVLTLGGSMMSVSAAERSLPGDFLYGLKLATEQARLVFVSGTAEKLKLKTEFTDRRVNELQQVAGFTKEPERVAEVAEILKRDLHTLKQQLVDVTREAQADKVVAAAKLVDRKTNAVIHALQAAKADLPQATKEKFTEVQSAAAETGVQAIEVLVAKHTESKTNVSAGDVTQAIQDHAKLVANVTRTAAPAVVATSTGAGTPSLQDAATGRVTHGITTLSTPTSSSSDASSTLPEMVMKMKAVSIQAFALQKVKELLEGGRGGVASGTSMESLLGPEQSFPSASSAPSLQGKNK